MKNPRTEITNESAKFVLNAYRPNGADAQDPVFRAALEQAARDPELAAWFKEQRSFDSLIAGKLAEVQASGDLVLQRSWPGSQIAHRYAASPSDLSSPWPRFWS